MYLCCLVRRPLLTSVTRLSSIRKLFSRLFIISSSVLQCVMLALSVCNCSGASGIALISVD